MGPHTADVTPSGVNTVGFSFEIFILFSYRITVPGTCIVEIRVALGTRQNVGHDSRCLEFRGFYGISYLYLCDEDVTQSNKI